MQKHRLQQKSNLDDSILTFASHPNGTHGEAVCLGYWSREEILTLLKQLLELERIGAKAYAEIGRAADLHTADIVFESELAQGAISVLLQKEIAMRGGADTFLRKSPSASPDVKHNPQHAIAFACSNQIKLADMIEEAILNISDSGLNAKLMYLLLLHRKQVEHLGTLAM
jgi:hypothetical protein